MTPNGFYIIKNNFFEAMHDPFLKNNKDGNRPFYYCVKEFTGAQNIYWMIPMSSRVEKFRAIINSKLESGKPCDGLYICKLPNGVENAFLIQDIFPVTDEYIEREYTLGKNHLILPYENDVTAIRNKANKVIKLIKRRIKLTPTSPNVLAILEQICAGGEPKTSQAMSCSHSQGFFLRRP